MLVARVEPPQLATALVAVAVGLPVVFLALAEMVVRLVLTAGPVVAVVAERAAQAVRLPAQAEAPVVQVV